MVNISGFKDSRIRGFKGENKIQGLRNQEFVKGLFEDILHYKLFIEKTYHCLHRLWPLNQIG